MINSINTVPNKCRGRLLATASAIALAASLGSTGAGRAADANGAPTLWIDIGWNVENVRDLSRGFALPLDSTVPSLTAPLVEDLALARSYSQDGKITFRPEDSDWVFSASIRYGRSNGAGKINQGLAPISSTFVTYKLTYPYYPQSNRSRAEHVPVSKEKLSADLSNAESHVIIDFQAGKDVGLGLFGRDSTSTLSAGLRFAHFTASRNVSNFHETHGIHFQSSHFMTTVWPAYITKAREVWNTISASGSSSQKFSGAGPSLQWDASAPLWSDPQAGGLSLDWGVNAALLFGKQNKKIEHQTTSQDHCGGQNCLTYVAHASNAGASTSKSITVPNIGGFAGFSLKFPGIKVSLGYRADLFVNAIDVGFATRKSSNLLLHGPFANVSIGLGD